MQALYFISFEVKFVDGTCVEGNRLANYSTTSPDIDSFNQFLEGFFTGIRELYANKGIILATKIINISRIF